MNRCILNIILLVVCIFFDKFGSLLMRNYIKRIDIL